MKKKINSVIVTVSKSYNVWQSSWAKSVYFCPTKWTEPVREISYT